MTQVLSLAGSRRGDEDEKNLQDVLDVARQGYNMIASTSGHGNIVIVIRDSEVQHPRIEVTLPKPKP